MDQAERRHDRVVSRVVRRKRKDRLGKRHGWNCCQNHRRRKTWNVLTVPDAEKLDFRDIEAFDANTAYILSIGNGESSRIYKTTDGGATWSLRFKNDDKDLFFDAIACPNRDICSVVSDPTDQQFVFVGTENGWKTVAEDYALTPQIIKDGEAAFAASGTCLINGADGTVFLVSGGSAARVFRFSARDGKETFDVSETPILRGTPSSGIFSIAMFDKNNGVIVGGNYEKPNEAKDNLAFTMDGGKTWKLGKGLSGYRSAVAYVDKKSVIAVGTNGTDLSVDGGKTWKKIGSEDLNAVAAKGKNSVWGVGPKGGVYKLK